MTIMNTIIRTINVSKYILTVSQDLHKISKKAGVDTTELEVRCAAQVSAQTNPLCMLLCDYLNHT